MVVLGHHVKISDWKVSYMSGMEIHVLLRKEAQYKQIGPVPPLGPVPPRRPSATMVVLGHHVKTSDWKVSYMSGWKFMFYCERRPSTSK